MKYLSDYMEARQTEALNKAGAFFAFSRDQFDKAKKEGVTYVNCGMGMLCPKENASELLKGLDEIYTSSIKQDIEENGLTAIIKRELNNHECYYSGYIDDCVDKLADYPVTRDDIQKVFKNKNHVIEQIV
jgi:hypothetical protein